MLCGDARYRPVPRAVRMPLKRPKNHSSRRRVAILAWCIPRIADRGLCHGACICCMQIDRLIVSVACNIVYLRKLCRDRNSCTSVEWMTHRRRVIHSLFITSFGRTQGERLSIIIRLSTSQTVSRHSGGRPFSLRDFASAYMQWCTAGMRKGVGHAETLLLIVTVVGFSAAVLPNHIQLLMQVITPDVFPRTVSCLYRPDHGRLHISAKLACRRRPWPVVIRGCCIGH